MLKYHKEDIVSRTKIKKKKIKIKIKNKKTVVKNNKVKLSNKVRFFKKDYWLDTMRAVPLKGDSRLNVLVDMTTQFLNSFQGAKSYAKNCVKQFNGQAVKIASMRLEIDEGYTVTPTWFQSTLAKMVTVSGKYSDLEVNTRDTLELLYTNFGWDLHKALKHDENDLYYTYRKVPFFAGVDGEKEIFDHIFIPMIPICQFGHGTKWEMKNGKVWTSHGLDDDGVRVILFREADGKYEEKKFQQHVVLKMTKLEVL